MKIVENALLFVQVAQAGSLTKAASILFSSKSNISRRIAQLEQQLDATLLHRTPRGLVLTEQGSQFYQSCLLMQQQFESAKEQLQQNSKSISGRIALTAPMSLGSLYLGPLLSKFQSLHPNLNLELDLSDNAKPLIESHYDIAIRAANKIPDSRLFFKLLHRYDYVIVGSPAYIQKYGNPIHPNELSSHRAITCITTHDSKLKSHWTFDLDGNVSEVKINSVAQVTHMWVQKQFALDSQGLIRVPRYWVKSELEDGRLSPLFEDYSLGNSNIYALYKSGGKRTRRVTAIIEYFAKHLPMLLS